MSDIVFFVKLFCLTVALVLVMQIHVGEQTLETHAMGWVQTSALVSPLNSVAHGAAKMARDVSTEIHQTISRNTAKKKKDVKDEKPKSTSSFRWFHRSGSGTETEQSASRSGN